MEEIATEAFGGDLPEIPGIGWATWPDPDGLRCNDSRVGVGGDITSYTLFTFSPPPSTDGNRGNVIGTLQNRTNPVVHQHVVSVAHFEWKVLIALSYMPPWG